ncbi:MULTISPECIES: hypothetical protein [Streptomyces]|uniref:hypothetical protein n=1 Tax=Streptomyces TaxID=1883 RepID=UPI0031F88FCE
MYGGGDERHCAVVDFQRESGGRLVPYRLVAPFVDAAEPRLVNEYAGELLGLPLLGADPAAQAEGVFVLVEELAVVGEGFVAFLPQQDAGADVRDGGVHGPAATGVSHAVALEVGADDMEGVAATILGGSRYGHDQWFS